MNNITIYHNPGCSTSRNTLELIRNRGLVPHIVEYLKTPPTRAELASLISAMGKSARDVLRSKEKLYAELDLGNPKWSHDELIDFMIAHPVLINRPIVVSPRGVRLCRPLETVLEILP